MKKVNCKICKDFFEVKDFYLKKGWGKYCSKKCHYLSMKKGHSVKCENCGESGYRSLSKLRHSKSGKYFCSKSCQTVWRNKEYIGPKHKLWKGGISTSFYKDILRRSMTKRVCKMCRTKDSRILAVHHIDRNHCNNKFDNLAYLCHNCHQLVHIDKKENSRFLSKIR